MDDDLDTPGGRPACSSTSCAGRTSLLDQGDDDGGRPARRRGRRDRRRGRARAATPTRDEVPAEVAELAPAPRRGPGRQGLGDAPTPSATSSQAQGWTVEDTARPGPAVRATSLEPAGQASGPPAGPARPTTQVRGQRDASAGSGRMRGGGRWWLASWWWSSADRRGGRRRRRCGRRGRRRRGGRASSGGSWWSGVAGGGGRRPAGGRRRGDGRPGGRVSAGSSAGRGRCRSWPTEPASPAGSAPAVVGVARASRLGVLSSSPSPVPSVTSLVGRPACCRGLRWLRTGRSTAGPRRVGGLGGLRPD